MLRAAGAAVHPRAMAGRHRAGGRADGGRPRTVPPVRRDDRRRCARPGRFTVPLDNGLSNAGCTARSRCRLPPGWRSTGSIRSRCSGTRTTPAATTTARWRPTCPRGPASTISRRASNDEKGPLTWPEGNGWIVKRLLERVGRFVRTGTDRCARSGATSPRSAFAPATPISSADAVIFAAPTFLAPYIIEGAPPLRRFEYSPWMTANLTLETIPDLDRGEPAWDNVIMSSPALGYVDAMHQSLRSVAGKTVWTFYWALAEMEPSAGPSIPRREGLGLLEGSHPDRPGARAPAHSGVRVASGRDADRPRDGASDGWRGVFGATTGAEAVTRSPRLRPLGRQRPVALRGSAIPRRHRRRSRAATDRVARHHGTMRHLNRRDPWATSHSNDEPDPIARTSTMAESLWPSSRASCWSSARSTTRSARAACERLIALAQDSDAPIQC